MEEFGKGLELQAQQTWRTAMGNVDSEPIPNEIVAERNNRALCRQVILDGVNWVSAIGGNMKAASDVSLPLSCTWRKTEALSGSGLGPFLLHPQQYCRNS